MQGTGHHVGGADMVPMGCRAAAESQEEVMARKEKKWIILRGRKDTKSSKYEVGIHRKI